MSLFLLIKKHLVEFEFYSMSTFLSAKTNRYLLKTSNFVDIYSEFVDISREIVEI